MKLDLLAFAAHPDDAELSCGGTLILERLKGRSTGVVDLTAGELGTRGNEALRAQEAEAASRVLGLSVRRNLGLADGFFTADRDSMLAVIECLRLYRPEVVLANALQDRHPDHARAAKLVADACFYSGLAKVETSHNGRTQEPWRPKALYHYLQDYYYAPHIAVNISSVFQEKIRAIEAYGSQFYNPESTEPETPISTEQFWQSLSERASKLGRLIGVEFAEGYHAARLPGVTSLFDLH